MTRLASFFVVLVPLGLACASPGAPRDFSTAGARTKLVMLGTGTPNAEPDRSGPALAIVVDDRAYLFDAGPGVVRRAAAAAELGLEALSVERLGIVFLTHLHSDHTLGLPDLLFTPWVLERDAPLQVIGPPGTVAMVEHVQAAWREDRTIRLEGLEPANDTGHRAEVHEVEDGGRFEDDLVTVEAFAVPHGNWEHALGYRIETPDRVIVVSGDTAPSEALVRMAAGCDVLVHEVYSAVSYLERPPVWKTYHASFHTSSTELAELASRIRPGLLVLTHQLYWGRTDEELLSEFEGLYDRPIVSARDLDVY